MRKISPRILIEGREIEYLSASYKVGGSLTAAVLTFSMPLQYAGRKKLWNKEVTVYMDPSDSTPIFRGWIKRTNPNFNDIEIHAEDALGYLLKGGETSVARVVLTNQDNLDGLSASAAIVKMLAMAKLDGKLKTDFIGNTTPVVGSTDAPIRGNVKILDVIKQFLSKAVDTSGTLPRPNLGRIIDDGTNSQFIIELESDITSDTAEIKHVYTEENNITDLSIINKRIPTVITVTGRNNVQGVFTHTSALEALDRNYFNVSNEQLTSPAACKDFASKLFEANLLLQYEYGLKTFDGIYLNENDIVMIQTDDPEFSGKYRIIGKNISFSPSSFSLTLSINKRPPVLSEYLSSLDN